MSFDNIREYEQDTQWQIGRRIQEMRLEKKLAAVDVAIYLDIKANQLSRIENGKANCTIPQMYVLAQILGCSVDYILFGKNTENSLSDDQMKAINNLLVAFKN